MVMEKEFCNYEQAFALKELGFDEPCFGMYHTDSMFVIQKTESHSQYYGQICSAPLKSQVFRWFREKYDLNYVIVKAESWFYTINGCNTQEGIKTYEEAESACIDKLISIVKE